MRIFITSLQLTDTDTLRYEKISAQTSARFVAYPLYGALSRRGLNPIKLTYNKSASAFNRLGYMPAVQVTGPTVTQNSPFLP